jgi:hypothetical protein
METIKRIDLSRLGVYTTGVMEYADKYPEARFCNTRVYDPLGRLCLIVSEYELSSAEKACDASGLMPWHDIGNGWQRNNDYGSFVCRKGERCILITN